MVLQRIQTVYLLLAATLMALLLFLPSGSSIINNAFNLHIGIVNAILAILAFILCVIATFSYRNLRRQATICAVTLLIQLSLLALICKDAYLTYSSNDGATPSPWTLCLPAAIVLVWLGRRGVIADKKLIESADRIR